MSSSNYIKTIILKTPEQCLTANSIIKKLTDEGNQILPSVLFPNEIHISYIPKDVVSNQKTNYNIITTDSGKPFFLD
jgi:hypothetical protein